MNYQELFERTAAILDKRLPMLNLYLVKST